jgi:hypothetical protein
MMLLNCQVGVLGPGEVEEVGCVPSGLLALCLSPDSELVTLVTADHQLIIMTRDYIPLSETPIQQGQSTEAWGIKSC